MSNVGVAKMGWYDYLWSDELWFPENSTGRRYGWKDLENRPGSSVYYPYIHDLHVSIVLALVMLVLRYFLNRIFITPLGYWMGVPKQKYNPPEHIELLEKAFTNHRKIDQKYIEELSKKSSMSEKKIQVWLRKRRQIDAPTSIEKFQECCWQFMFYVAALTAGIKILWTKDWLWDTKYCWVNWPLQHIDSDVYWYYIFECAFYWGLLFTIFKENKRKDRNEMILHHVATIILIYFSWLMNLVRLGTLVLLVHDGADPILMFGKMCNYSKQKLMKEVTFIVFIVVWFITRLVIFPFRILWSTTVEPYYYVIEKTFFTHMFFNFFLYLLMALHLMWSFFIAQAIYRTFKKGNVEDSRSDSESD